MFPVPGRWAATWRPHLRKVLAKGAGLGLAMLAIPAVPAVTGRARAAAAQPTDPDQAARSAVALAADPGGSDAALYRGQGDAVYLRWMRQGTWSAQSSLGGVIVGG